MANSSNIVRPHVPEEELHAYCDGELFASQRVEIAEHLLGCLICRSQHAEVEVLRTRTSTLLAMAMPSAIHGFDVRELRPHRIPNRMPRFIAVAAIAAVSAGLWFTVRPDRMHEGAAKFAMSAGTPNLMADADPAIASGWQQANWNTAVKAGETLSTLAGLTVASVRMHPSATGGRPTFMIRQTLADGRPVWVFEGPDNDVMSVDQVLQASGIAMSIPVRAKPEDVPSNGELSRTRRTVTVVGHLSADSLNVLAGKLDLK